MITPREYQIEAVKAHYTYFSEKAGNPVIAMPTGTGKSVVIAMFLQSLFWQWPGQRVLVLTHVKELIDQNHQKLLSIWPAAPAGIYSAGLGRKEANRAITFAGIGSIAKKAALFGHIDLVLVDEAHMVSTNDETLYRKFLTDLREFNPLLKVVGYTATPWRLGTGRITDGGVFDDVAYDITGMSAFNSLITDGFLCPLIAKKTELMLDTEGVHMRGGEFVASELQLAVDKYEVTRAAISEALEQAADRQHWLVFASGVDHAVHIAEMLNDMGVSAVAIHSKMPDAERDGAIADFKKSRYRVAVNNNVLTTGFDYPEIDCIVVLRPTSSTVLWVQMLGRGTRPHPSKQNTLVLDFAGNTRRLGPINDPVIPRKKGDKAGGEAPVKLCGWCATYNHASATHCVNCGKEFTFQVKIKTTASTEEVMKVDLPVVEVFRVDHVTYSRHEKIGRPPVLKVTYYCNIRAFTDYVCIEHDGFAQRKARMWWTERGEQATPFPVSTDEGLQRSPALRTPTHINVWTNKKYPEIMAYCFDGSAFGKNRVNP